MLENANAAGGTALAQQCLVVVRMSATVRAERRGTRGASGGFTLIELMVVVIVVGILAILAIPSFTSLHDDRAAYSDAGAIMGLFREARTRAIARGGAEMVQMTASSTDRGTFTLWEAVSQDPNNTAGAAPDTPMPSCGTPTNWAGSQCPTTTTYNGFQQCVQQIDVVNINGNVENTASIQSQLLQYTTSATGAPFNAGFLCYTPLGRSYFAEATAATQYMFDGMLPIVSLLEARVTRQNGATIRSVFMPPNGMARIFSHT